MRLFWRVFRFIERLVPVLIGVADFTKKTSELKDPHTDCSGWEDVASEVVDDRSEVLELFVDTKRCKPGNRVVLQRRCKRCS